MLRLRAVASKASSTLREGRRLVREARIHRESTPHLIVYSAVPAHLPRTALASSQKKLMAAGKSIQWLVEVRASYSELHGSPEGDLCCALLF